MTVGMILLILLIIIMISVVPRWDYSGNWGWYPTGGIGIVVAIILILLLLGKI